MHAISTRPSFLARGAGFEAPECADCKCHVCHVLVAMDATDSDYSQYTIWDELTVASPNRWTLQGGKKYAASSLKFNRCFEWSSIPQADKPKFDKFFNLPDINVSANVAAVLFEAKQDIAKVQGLHGGKRHR